MIFIARRGLDLCTGLVGLILTLCTKHAFLYSKDLFKVLDS